MTHALQSLPQKVRERIYLGYSVVVLALGAATVYFQAVNLDAPDWINGATQVMAYIGVAIGFTAAANANTPELPGLGDFDATVDPAGEDLPVEVEDDGLDPDEEFHAEVSQLEPGKHVAD